MKQAILIFLSFLFLSMPAYADKETVPVEATVGPAAHIFFGNIQKDTPYHYGLKLDLEAIISKQMIMKYKGKIPKKYRKYAGKVDSVSFRPAPYIPETLIISPLETTQVYGMIWKFLGLGTGFGPEMLRVNLGVTLNFAAMYIHSNRDLSGDLSKQNSASLSNNAMENITENTTYFVRPGLGAEASITFMPTKSFGLSAGWKSHLFIPQRLNGGIFDTGGFSGADNNLWHIGQGFVTLHIQFPFKVKI